MGMNGVVLRRPKKAVFRGCARGFLQNNEDQFGQVGEECRNRGLNTCTAHFFGILKRF